MGNFFSKEKAQSTARETSSTSGKVPASSLSDNTSNSKSMEEINDESHISFEIGSVGSKTKSSVVETTEKSYLSFEIGSGASKSQSAAGTTNNSHMSFELDSVATKSKVGLSLSLQTSKKKLESPVSTRSKPEKGNQSYIMSKMPKLEAQIYVPKDGEYYEFNSYELGGNFTVLVFYSGNFCSGVLPELHELKSVSRKTLEDYNLLAISTDTKESHKAFSHLSPEQGGLQNLNFVLVADHTGEWSKTFQVYDESCHKAFPSYIILSADMRILFKESFDHNVGGNPNHIIGILNQLMEDTKVSDKDIKAKETSDNISRSDSSHMRVSSDPEISSTFATKSASAASSASRQTQGTTGSTKSSTSSGASELTSRSATSATKENETSSSGSMQASESGSSISKKSDRSVSKKSTDNNLPKEPIMPAKKDNSSSF